MSTEIFADYNAFLHRRDSAVNGVSPVFAKAHPEWAEERGNRSCWNCSRCSDCAYCFRCSDCAYCFRCSDCAYCAHCFGCSDCSDCSGCSYCSGCSG